MTNEKNKVVRARITDQDKAILDMNAKEAELNTSEYVRLMSVFAGRAIEDYMSVIKTANQLSGPVQPDAQTLHNWMEKSDEYSVVFPMLPLPIVSGKPVLREFVDFNDIVTRRQMMAKDGADVLRTNLLDVVKAYVEHHGNDSDAAE